MTKKKIIIVNNNLNIGGVQKALLSLLKEIENEYDITLYLFNNFNKVQNHLIPKSVKVIEAKSFLKVLGEAQSNINKESKYLAFFRAIMVGWTKVFGNKIPFKILFFPEKRLKNFDIAISYLHVTNNKSFYGGCVEFVLEKIEATKKIGFIHCDFLNYGGNTSENRKLYCKLDGVATVSESCKKSFLQAIPSLNDRVYKVENFHDYNSIQELASNNPFEYEKSIFNIVTISRLSSEKGLIRTLFVIKKIIEDGHLIMWNIVGDGSLKEEIIEIINNYNLKDYIKIYGDTINPYRYLPNADLFLLPSLHEAAPLVISEAMSLGVPVLATETLSAREIIAEYKQGFICENSEEGIYTKLKWLVDNPEYLNKSRIYLKENSQNNRNAREDIKRLLIDFA